MTGIKKVGGEYVFINPDDERVIGIIDATLADPNDPEIQAMVLNYLIERDKQLDEAEGYMEEGVTYELPRPHLKDARWLHPNRNPNKGR